MVVVMQERATEVQIEKVVAHLVELGLDVHRSTGVSRTVLGAVGDDRNLDPRLLEMLDGVSEVLRVTEPYKLASRAFRPEGTVVSMGDVRIGGDEVIVMAGPCSAETAEQVDTTAAAVQARRREGPAWRRLQAAQLTLQLPGPRRRGPAAVARGRQPARSQAGLRSDGRQPDPGHREVPATCSRSARGTCRTSHCSASWAARESRCC